MSPALSACLIARDEAERLPACLDALGFADELVVVVDARSRDASERIARERGARVERRPFAGDVAQKRDCVALARNEWVLVIDPDEVVSPALAAELKDALADPGGAAGFELNRLTWHLGRWLRHGDFHPDWKLRVFQRSRARFSGRDPHGRVEVAGPVRRLRGDLLHYSYRDLADQVERIQLFSAEAARALHAEGRRARLSDLLLRPPARFLRAYLLNRGFLDGRPGLIVAALTAFHVFLKYAKLWESGGVRRTPPDEALLSGRAPARFQRPLVESGIELERFGRVAAPLWLAAQNPPGDPARGAPDVGTAVHHRTEGLRGSSRHRRRTRHRARVG